MWELPPRARRILLVDYKSYQRDGTTSACAENTLSRWWIELALRNYLRVRGEYSTSTTGWNPWGELPPRARRILAQDLKLPILGGTTSACAENTGAKP